MLFDCTDKMPMFLARKVLVAPTQPNQIYPALRLLELNKVLGADLATLRDIETKNLDSIWWQNDDPTGLWGVVKHQDSDEPTCEERVKLTVYKVTKPSTWGVFSVDPSQYYVEKLYTWFIEDHTEPSEPWWGRRRMASIVRASPPPSSDEEEEFLNCWIGDSRIHCHHPLTSEKV